MESGVGANPKLRAKRILVGSGIGANPNLLRNLNFDI